MLRNIFRPVYKSPLAYPIGVETEGSILPMRQYIRAKRHYKFSVRWYEAELWPQQYTWPQTLIDNVQCLTEYEKILTVKTCPSFYRLWPEHIGSPPHPDHYNDFAWFIKDALWYTGAKFLEIGNEPNVRPSEMWLEDQKFYGCWVGDNETYEQGGVRYAEIIKAVAPLIRREVPGVKILAGALNVGAYDKTGSSYRFMSGVMSKFKYDYRLPWDAVSVHPYLDYDWGLAVSTDMFSLPFEHAVRLRQLTRSPILFTETAIIRSEVKPDSDHFRQRQVEWLRYLKSNIPNATVKGATWFSLANPWRRCGLIRGEPLAPTPAYEEWARNE